MQNLDKFKKALPNVNFTDIGVPTMKLRMVKSKEEIEVVRNGEYNIQTRPMDAVKIIIFKST